MHKFQIPKFVTFIINRLENFGHKAYIVGGAVRDNCLSLPVTDWDMTTSALPAEIENVFQDNRLFTLKKGTVTIVDSGCHFEVTTFRGTENCIEDDLAHRDFTINAMAYDIEQAKILDPYEGQKDIGRKLIKTSGDPKARFREDPLRILRAVRLATKLKFTIDAATIDGMKDTASLLLNVAPERVRDELGKTLTNSRPSTGFKIMRTTGILEYILPELLEGYMMRQNAFHKYTIFKHIMKTVDNVRPDKILRLSALLHDIAKPRVRKKNNGEWRFIGHEKASADLAGKIMERLKFSKDIIKKTTNLIRHHMIDYDSNWTDGAVRRLIRRAGQNQIKNLLTLREADLLAHGLHKKEFNLLKELEKRVEKLIKNPVVAKTRDLAIDGHRVMEILGIPAGHEVGNILNVLVEKVTDKPNLNTEKSLTSVLKHMKME